MMKIVKLRLNVLKKLLSLYETSHSSKDCTAVQAAIPLVRRGISPVGRIELVEGYIRFILCSTTENGR